MISLLIILSVMAAIAFQTPNRRIWRKNGALLGGKGFGNAIPAKRTKEQEMIDDIRATLLERPKEEALHYNLGLLLLSSSPNGAPDEGTKREAMMAFQNSVMLNPERIGSWYNLAVLSDEFGDASRALEGYDRVLQLTGKEEEQLRVAAYSNKVTIYTNQGNLEAAAKTSETAVKEFPNEGSLWCAMGVVLRMDRNVEWATKSFENALACCEENRKQDENCLVALNNLGALYASSAIAGDAEAGNAMATKAATMYERALELAPNDLSTLYGLGVLRRDMGQTSQARTTFGKAAAIAPHDRQISYQLALLDRAEGKEVELDAAPKEYVASLFDYYASNDYDEHLLSLEYRGPELLWRAFEASAKYNSLGGSEEALGGLRVLEVGCGSGLVGKLFRSKGLGYSFEGCDLSSVMARKATDAIFPRPDDPSNIDMVYSSVECTDAETFLRKNSGSGADLVLGGDVLCYLGRLEDILEAAEASLGTGGHFIFTVEKMFDSEKQEPRGYTLRSSGRFAHAKEYVEEAANKAGMKVEACQEETIRLNNRQPVEGLVFTLGRGG